MGRGIQQMIWVCSTCNYLLLFCCEDSWCTTYLFVDFPFMWLCNVLDGMPHCLATAWALSSPLPADSFHGCMQLFIIPQVLFSFVLVHCWHCYCTLLLLLFINECFRILRIRGLTFDLSMLHFVQSVISRQYFCPCRACVKKSVDSK